MLTILTIITIGAVETIIFIGIVCFWVRQSWRIQQLAPLRLLAAYAGLAAVTNTALTLKTTHSFILTWGYLLCGIPFGAAASLMLAIFFGLVYLISIPFTSPSYPKDDGQPRVKN